jgi:dihydroneopterin aldolase/2-amino-4-hydroxy-6-hydroxymethyldihydropteridine diphosphokinase/dihydropteroate synthase
VQVRNLQLITSVGDGAQWPSDTGEPKRQPILVSLDIPYNLRGAASEDDIQQSVNYGSLSRTLSQSIEPLSFPSLELFIETVFEKTFSAFASVHELKAVVTKPRALPYAGKVSITSRRKRNGERVYPDRYELGDLVCNLIVGLNPCEREDKQVVHFDVAISRDSRFEQAFGFRALGKSLREVWPVLKPNLDLDS